jgi:hypothetical protein
LLFINKRTVKCLSVVLIAILIATVSVAQPYVLKLRSGQFLPTQSSLNGIDLNSDLYAKSVFNNRLYLIIQCKKSFGEQDRKKLSQIGIRIIDFIPEKSYLVEISNPISEASLHNAGIYNIVEVQPNFKMFPVLKEKASGNIGKEGAELDITIVGFPGVPYSELASELLLHNFLNWPIFHLCITWKNILAKTLF